jgi:hypothetical protein
MTRRGWRGAWDEAPIRWWECAGARGCNVGAMVCVCVCEGE